MLPLYYGILKYKKKSPNTKEYEIGRQEMRKGKVVSATFNDY